MQLTLADGHILQLPDLPVERPAVGPYVVLSMRKCGSSLVHVIAEQIAAGTGVPVLDIPHALFSQNLPARLMNEDPAFLDLVDAGVILNGFRTYPEIFDLSALYRAAPKVLFVRDPRDALVSEYFSVKFSHQLPTDAVVSGSEGVRAKLEADRARARTQPVDTFVRERCGSFAQSYRAFLKLADDTTVLVLRYEDYIFDKPALVRAILDQFALSLSEPAIARIARETDICPDVEQPDRHVRKVTPGDHREKLAPETIAELNGQLHDILTTFGYAQ
jgi:hypothetical protein